MQKKDFEVLHYHRHQPCYDHHHHRHRHHHRRRYYHLDYSFDDFHRIEYRRIQFARHTKKKPTSISIRNNNEHHD